MTVRMGCPYLFCSAVVEAVEMRPYSNTTGTRLMTPYHEIQNPIITGGCPGSNLWIPITPEGYRVMAEVAETHRRLINERLDNPPEPRVRDQQARRGGGFPQRPIGPSGVPHRLGREPVTPEDQGSWNPPRGQEPERPLPPHVSGTPLGSRGMADIGQLVAMTTEANVQSGEAVGALAQAIQTVQNALGAIEAAKSQASAVLGSTHAQTMSDYVGVITQAEVEMGGVLPQLEQARDYMASGMEKGEAYIGILMS